MARMLKLTLSPSGTLVYRATGRAYQGKTTVRDGRVYGENGRLIGYLGKPTTRQQMLKLTLSPSGTLVYRATGRAYQGKATVRDGRVYGKNGGLIGYLGKPTTKQQREIERLDRRRVSDRRRRELDRTLANLETRYQSAGTQAVFGIYTRRQITEINFGHFLTEAVNAGKMSKREARQRLERYLNTETSDERTKQWDELKGRFEELGFPYP